MHKIKILPVYPKFPLTFWSFKSAVEYIGKKAVMPPTGLATVLAMLPEEHFDIQRIIDLNVEPLTDKQIKQADMIFTSTMIVQENSHNEIIKRVHKLGKKVVAGGPFPTSYPERCNADYIVAGEAELTLAPFLSDLLNGNPRRIYAEKDISAEKPSLSNTPVPRLDLLKMSEYSSASVQYSRGCPFNCEFCDITALFGRVPRTKTPHQMVQELEAILASNHRGGVFILDDNFIANRKNLRQFLPVLIDWQRNHRYPFRFGTEASMDLAWEENRDILESMVEAGIDDVFLGIENPDPDTVKSMNKPQNTKIPPLEAVRIIQNAGIKVTGGFIVGSDGDKKTVFEDLFRFIQDAGIVIPMPGLLGALKGTPLYSRLEQEGRLKMDSKGDNTHHLSFNFETKLDSRFLTEGYAGLLSQLFNAKNYYQRCRTQQEYLGKSILPRIVGKAEVSAFFKSMSRQLFAPGGREYARFLAHTILTRPSKFPTAVEHGVKFDHFSKLTRAALGVRQYEHQANSMYERFKVRAQEVYARYSAGIQSASSAAEDKVHQLANKIISKAERRYNRLHHDFREDARKTLEDLKARVYAEIDNFRMKRPSPAS